MFAEFIDSWALFHNAWLAGWLIALALAITGVWVVARDQIFLGAAVAQASTFGVALALGVGAWCGVHWFDSDASLTAAAVSCAVAASLLASRAGRRESHEAVTGWVYLVAASTSVLLVARSPHGLDEVQRLFSSSIIGASTGDMWLFAGLAGATVAAAALGRHRLVLCALDPAFAAALGARPQWWSTGAGLWLGLATGLSIRSSGALYCLGCLVLPALIAKRLCRELGAVFWVAPAVAMLVTGFAFVFANHADLPPGQVAVAGLAAGLVMVWLVDWVRRCVRGG